MKCTWPGAFRVRVRSGVQGRSESGSVQGSRGVPSQGPFRGPGAFRVILPSPSKCEAKKKKKKKLETK